MMCVSHLVFSMLSTALVLADGPVEGKKGGPAARPAQLEGVTVESPERKLSESEKTPQGELKAILSTAAVLKTERAIRYRSVVLKPGSYPISVVEDERGAGRNLYFVIGPAAGSGQGGADAAPVAKPEEKKSEKSGEKPADPAGGPSVRKRAGDPGAAKSVPGQIRAIFHLLPSKTPSEKVQFTIRPTLRGGKLVLMVRAGSSQGKAVLKYDE